MDEKDSDATATSGIAVSAPKSTYASSITTGMSGCSSSRVGDLGTRQRRPDRRVGIGQDDRAGGTAIIGDADPHGVIQRHSCVNDIEQPAPDRIKTVGYVREKQRRVMLQQSGEGMRQHLVRAVADEDLFGPHVMIRGQSRSQRGGLGIRIQAQRVGRLGADRLQHARRRADRALVGIELDQIRHTRLLARHIRLLQVMRQAAPETAHVLRCHHHSVSRRHRPLRRRRSSRSGGNTRGGWQGRGLGRSTTALPW